MHWFLIISSLSCQHDAVTGFQSGPFADSTSCMAAAKATSHNMISGLGQNWIKRVSWTCVPDNAALGNILVGSETENQ